MEVYPMTVAEIMEAVKELKVMELKNIFIYNKA